MDSSRGSPRTSADPSAPEAFPRRIGPADDGGTGGNTVFLLPGGHLAEDGTVHREVELAPITGHEEEYIALLPRDVSVASAVTGLLSRCVKRIGTLRPVTAQITRELLVSDRDYLILKLREVSFGGQIDALLHCPAPACDQPIQLDFSLDAFAFARRTLTNRFFTVAAAVGTGEDSKEETEMEFRLPTGADQESLAEMVRRKAPQVENRLLARCLRRVGRLARWDETFVERLSSSTRVQVENRMAELAPLMMLELEGICPSCQRPYSTPFDGTAFFLAEIRAHADRLENEVHLLAWHYHWSESEILSLPIMKRRRYVRCLERRLEPLSGT